jgi:hypothetical protein
MIEKTRNGMNDAVVVMTGAHGFLDRHIVRKLSLSGASFVTSTVADITLIFEPKQSSAHYSNIYYSASLAALCQLGARKGYSFAGCNAAGNNACFVRNKLKPPGPLGLTPKEGFVQLQFREARDASGSLAFLTEAREAAILNQLPLVEAS